MENEIVNKKRGLPLIPIVAVLMVLGLAVSPVGATILTFIGNFLTSQFTVQAPITNTWNLTGAVGITNATLLGNFVSGGIVAGNPVSLPGNIVNVGAATSRNVIFNFTSTNNSLTAADIPISTFTFDGAPVGMVCAPVAPDYICTASALGIGSGSHSFNLTYSTSIFYNTSAGLGVSQMIQ